MAATRIGIGVGDRPALRSRHVQPLARQAAVVAVQVVGGDERVARLGQRRLPQRFVRARRPVQPRRTIVRAREVPRLRLRTRARSRRSRRSCTPTSRSSTRRARRSGRSETSRTSRGTSSRRSRRRSAGCSRGEIVQRFLGPALIRKLVDNPPDDAEVFVVVAELARRDRVEEQRFALPRALLEKRLQRRRARCARCFRK